MEHLKSGSEAPAAGASPGTGRELPAALPVPDDALILHEEPFGPVAPILPFADESEMLARANGLEFGLASYVVTNDVHRQQRLTDALEYGVVGVNGR